MSTAMRRRGLVMGALCAGLLLSSGAHADDPPTAGDAEQTSDQSAYDDAVESGFKAFEAGDYETARVQFSRAHALYPNARTLRALGKVSYELSLYQSSVEYLEQALASNERPLTQSQRHETEDLLVRVRANLAPVTLSVHPAAASLLLDGRPIALPADGKVMLAIGEHLLELSAPGYRPERHPLRVLPSVDQRVNVALMLADPAPTERQLMGRAAKWWIWGSVGAAVVAGAVAGVVIATRDPGTREPTGGSTGMTITIGN